MNDSIKQFLIQLYDEYKDQSWTHPRTLLLLAVLTKNLGYKNFVEVGTWLGAVPIMVKKIENYFNSDQLSNFVLIENFVDHVSNGLEIADKDSLIQHINTHIPNSKVTVYNDVLEINSRIDVIHFDSVKYQRELIAQFDQLKKYFTANTLYIFDDYIAEWSDVAYCVDVIASYNNLVVVAAFGPKIYLCSPELKQHILRLIKNNQELSSYIDVRTTIKHGDVLGSNYNLNL